MQKKGAFVKIISFLGIVAFGAAVGYWVGKMTSGSSNLFEIVWPAGAKILLIALLLPAALFTIAWHEAGHAAAGVAMGFDFRMYVVGPFMWEKENGRWRFKWNRNLNTAGGLVLCVPTELRDVNRKSAMYAAAGPLSSLLLTLLIAFAGYFLLPGLVPIRHWGLALVVIPLLAAGLISFLIFIATSIPSNMGGFYSDGARVLRALRGGDTAKFDAAFLKLITGSMAGIRPKLLDTRELEEMQALAARLNEPLGVYLHGYLHQAAFDRGDAEAAEKHLLDCVAEMDKMPAGIRDMVWLDAAFFYAYAKKDLAQAEQFWEKFKPSAITPKAQILATEAAIAALKNDPDTARSKKEAAMAELPNMMDQGIAAALIEKLVA